MQYMTDFYENDMLALLTSATFCFGVFRASDTHVRSSSVMKPFGMHTPQSTRIFGNYMSS